MAINMTARNGEEVQNIVQELERQKATRRDYVVPVRDLEMQPDGNTVTLNMGHLGGADVLQVFPIRKIAHEHLAEKAQIPPQFYRRVQAEAPDLLAANVNRLIGIGGKNHLVRTLDGEVRAVLSDRFRALDSFDLFFEAYPVLKEAGAAITRADLTEEHFFLRALVHDWEERIGDWGGGSGTGIHTFRRTNPNDMETVVPGILISNSDVGRGGLKAEVFIHFGQCSNGAVLDRSIYKVHTGRQLDAGFLSNETKELEDRTVWSQVRDLIRSTFNRDEFKKLVATMQGEAAEELANPVQAVDAVVQHYGWSDLDRQSILNELIAPKTRDIDPGRTVYGLIQAVTAQAHRTENYEDALVYERAGGELLTGSAGKIFANYRERELVPVSPRSAAAHKAAQTRRANRVG